MRQELDIQSMQGVVDKIQRYCIHDGPGIRTVVFLKGCMMRCPWCSNPESISDRIQLAWNKEKCIQCGVCVSACPQQAITEKTYEVDKSKCDLCGVCTEVCLQDAWTLFGARMQVREVISEIEKDRAFFRRSGGGVTFSGGECTVQSEFLLALLKECHTRGFHTAIESNGYIESETLKKLVDYIDEFLIDIKHMNNREHEIATGFGNELILSNIRRIVFEWGKKLSLRIPLIPGYNDSIQNVDAMVSFANELATSKNLKEVNILPYHSFGISKYKLLGLDYTMKDITRPTEQQIEQVINAFRSVDLPVVKGG